MAQTPTSEASTPTARDTEKANKPSDKPEPTQPLAITQLKLVLAQQSSPDGLGEPIAVVNIK